MNIWPRKKKGLETSININKKNHDGVLGPK
jgi:hypothetical protein